MRFSWEHDPDAVPVDELRRYARQECKQRSRREIAAEIGLGRTTLHNFVTRETNRASPRPQPPPQVVSSAGAAGWRGRLGGTGRPAGRLASGNRGGRVRSPSGYRGMGAP